MLSKRIELLKTVAFVGITSIIIIVTIVAIANITDIKIDVLNINPSDNIHRIFVHLDLPPQGLTRYESWDENGTTVNLPLLSINMILQYNGTLVEGIPVLIFANGFAYPEGQKTIAHTNIDDAMNNPLLTLDQQKSISRFSTDQKIIPMVIVGYEMADNYYATSYGLNDGQFLIPLQSISHYSSSYGDIMKGSNATENLSYVQTIVWNERGDYYPFITIAYNNKTFETTTYPNRKIHVNGYEVLQEEKYARTNTWISTALFFFALIASFQLLIQTTPDYLLKLLGIKKPRCKGNKYNPKN